MIKFFRNIPRHFKEARNGIVRNFAMTLSSASAVTVTLVLIGAFLLVAVNLDSFMTSVEEGVQIHVRIEDTVSEDKISSLQASVEAISGVRSVVYSDKDSELDALIEVYGEEGELFETYRGDANPLKRAFVVEVTDGLLIDEVTAKIEAVPGIFSALYGGSSIIEMMSAFENIKSGGIIFVLILSALAVFLISNTIKLTIFARQDEIRIMRLVGASNGYIRTPFLLEGIFIGLLGAILPIGLVYFGYTYLYTVTGGYFFTPLFTLITPQPFLMYISGALAGIAIIVGLIGSYISVSRYLWWKR
ncbi:MAG: permease-like cell division protein FtsX [Erysipelotrichales bacterium]|nr:permease-like cell division protein FtsX [Erysipelotrichales bacterium]